MDTTIKKITELTKDGKIDWYYLDTAKSIYDPLNYSYIDSDSNNISTQLAAALTNTKIKYFDNANSFYAKIKSNYILLITDTDTKKLMIERIKLVLVPRTFKEPKYFSGDEDILYLHTLVKAVFPSADDIINDLFTM